MWRKLPWWDIHHWCTWSSHPLFHGECYGLRNARRAITERPLCQFCRDRFYCQMIREFMRQVVDNLNHSAVDGGSTDSSSSEAEDVDRTAWRTNVFPLLNSIQFSSPLVNSCEAAQCFWLGSTFLAPVLLSDARFRFDNILLLGGVSTQYMF